MNVATAKTLLKRQGFDDSDPLDAWLRAAKFELEEAHEWPFLVAEVVATLAANTTPPRLTLPTGFVKVITMYETNVLNDKLDPVDIHSYYRDLNQQDVGLPAYYSVIGSSSVAIWRTPDKDLSFKLTYTVALGDWTSDTNDLPGPERVHYPIVQIAKAIALGDENEEDRATVARANADNAVARVWNKYSSIDSGDDPKQVVDVMGYGDS